MRAIASATVKTTGSVFCAYWMMLTYWVLLPQFSLTSALLVDLVAGAVKVTLEVPAAPDMGDTVSHSGTVVASTSHAAVVLRSKEADPPFTPMER